LSHVKRGADASWLRNPNRRAGASFALPAAPAAAP
jgi:hypothetical protein